MKKYLFCILFLALLSCSSDDRVNNCNFLLNVNVNLSINLNLPQFNQLNLVSNSVRVEGQGNNGIIITRVSSESLRAWDGADPNQIPTSCSRLGIEGAITAVSGCEDANTYSLITGQSLNEPLPCGLLEYRVDALGNNTFLITN